MLIQINRLTKEKYYAVAAVYQVLCFSLEFSIFARYFDNVFFKTKKTLRSKKKH